MTYSYSEFLANVAGRFPSGFCWGCVVQPDERERCGRESVAVDAHHVLPKQLLKREFPGGVVLFDGRAEGVPVRFNPDVELTDTVTFERRSLDALLMDGRNGVIVRRFHHDAIEGRAVVPSLRAVPLQAREFAAELGLEHHLERIYGQGRRRRGQ